MLNSLKVGDGEKTIGDQRTVGDQVHQGWSFGKDETTYLKVGNRGRGCFPAGAKKEAPGKSIGCSFKQNPARQITEVFHF